MTATRHLKLRIGVFAAIAGTLVGVVIAVWGGLHLLRHRDRYVIDIDGSVYGLVRGAEVFYDGVSTGNVRSIEVSPRDIRRVRVEIEVDRGTPVRTDTTATLSLAGITGAKVIDLRAGLPTAPPLPPGGTIAVGQSTLDRVEHQLDAGSPPGRSWTPMTTAGLWLYEFGNVAHLPRSQFFTGAAPRGVGAWYRYLPYHMGGMIGADGVDLRYRPTVYVGDRQAITFPLLAFVSTYWQETGGKELFLGGGLGYASRTRLPLLVALSAYGIEDIGSLIFWLSHM